MSTYPSTAEIRERAAKAEKVAEAPFLESNGAAVYLRCLQDALALLRLYIGNEPTVAEELAYRATELDRLHGMEDGLRAMRTELVDGLQPDLIRRHALVRRLSVILADESAEAGETA